MNTTHAVIIEDEIPAARLLHAIVSGLRPDWHVETLPGSVDEAAAWLSSHELPQLIFLDIHLADGDAFDLLSQAKPRAAVVFTTAYDQYAIRAFTANSIGYILKPVDEQRVAEAIAKYERLCPQGWWQTGAYMDMLIDALRQPQPQYRTRFLISAGDSYWSLQTDTIAYFLSEDKITYAVTPDGRQHAIDLSLNRLETQLDPRRFFRINRQMILSIDAIDRAVPYFKGRVKVKVRPPHTDDVIVSEGRAAAFRLWLDY